MISVKRLLSELEYYKAITAKTQQEWRNAVEEVEKLRKLIEGLKSLKK